MRFSFFFVLGLLQLCGSHAQPAVTPNGQVTAAPEPSPASTVLPPPSMPQSPLQAPSVQAGEVEKELKIEDILSKRDPFKKPSFADPKLVVSELQLFEVHALKLVAVISGDPKKLKAMVLAPNGKTYVVGRRQKIGTRGGIVSKITSEALVVTEKITNLLGKTEDIESEISLAAEESSK